MRYGFYRLVIGRLSLAAVVIAALFGGGVWLYEMERIDDTVVALATAEAGAFADQNQEMLTGDAHVDVQLSIFLTDRARGPDGHFVFAEIYSADHRSLAEASLGGIAPVEAAFDRRAHPFPRDGRPHYDKITLDGKFYVRALIALRSGAFDGYFEGIFEIAPARLDRIKNDVIATVLIVIGVVAGTTLFLLPIVIGLNRHLVRLNNRLTHANVEILEVLGGAIAKRDTDTGQHNYRVTLYAVHLAEAMGRSHDEIRALIKGAFLHDVGKIAIRDAILLKPGKLTADEFTTMKTHVVHGVEIVARSHWLGDAVPVVAGHHEKFDGSGYPAGLAGGTIPMNARIFAVVDVFDALVSRRPYKEPMSFERAMAILEEGRGRHFDPEVLDVFTRIAGDLQGRFADAAEEALRDALMTMTARIF